MPIQSGPSLSRSSMIDSPELTLQDTLTPFPHVSPSVALLFILPFFLGIELFILMNYTQISHIVLFFYCVQIMLGSNGDQNSNLLYVCEDFHSFKSTSKQGKLSQGNQICFLKFIHLSPKRLFQFMTSPVTLTQPALPHVICSQNFLIL